VAQSAQYDDSKLIDGFLAREGGDTRNRRMAVASIINQPRRLAMKKALVVVAFFLISSFTAAVGADEFYIVRDLATQKLSVLGRLSTTVHQNNNIGH
jgi:hypothetical protein